MVYGRYNELVFMGFLCTNKHHWGAPSCMEHDQFVADLPMQNGDFRDFPVRYVPEGQ